MSKRVSHWKRKNQYWRDQRARRHQAPPPYVVVVDYGLTLSTTHIHGTPLSGVRLSLLNGGEPIALRVDDLRDVDERNVRRAIRSGRLDLLPDPDDRTQAMPGADSEHTPLEVWAVQVNDLVAEVQRREGDV